MFLLLRPAEDFCQAAIWVQTIYLALERTGLNRLSRALLQPVPDIAQFENGASTATELPEVRVSFDTAARAFDFRSKRNAARKNTDTTTSHICWAAAAHPAGWVKGPQPLVTGPAPIRTRHEERGTISQSCDSDASAAGGGGEARSSASAGAPERPVAAEREPEIRSVVATVDSPRLPFAARRFRACPANHGMNTARNRSAERPAKLARLHAALPRTAPVPSSAGRRWCPAEARGWRYAGTER